MKRQKTMTRHITFLGGTFFAAALWASPAMAGEARDPLYVFFDQCAAGDFSSYPEAKKAIHSLFSPVSSNETPCFDAYEEAVLASVCTMPRRDFSRYVTRNLSGSWGATTGLMNIMNIKIPALCNNQGDKAPPAIEGNNPTSNEAFQNLIFVSPLEL